MAGPDDTPMGPMAEEELAELAAGEKAVLDPPRGEFGAEDTLPDGLPAGQGTSRRTRSNERTAGDGGGSPSPTPCAGPAPDGLWVEVPRKRALPKRARMIIAGAAGLLILVTVLAGRSGAPRIKEVVAKLPDEVVISEEDLKNRREVSADDFHPKRQFLEEPPARTAASQKSGEDDELAERRARRERDPEDVLTLRRKQAVLKDDEGLLAPKKEKTSPYDRPLFIEAEPGRAVAARADDSHWGQGREQTLAPAGTVVAATLATPISLGGGSATVVARADGDALPRGSRLIGTASASSDGRISMHFAKVLLPDGRVARVSAEAQDHSGAFGVMGAVDGSMPEEPSVAGEVAKETATDVALDALGVGVAGSAARSYSRQSASRSYRGSFGGATVSLGAGATFSVFFHEPAVIRDGP